jgi:hypothetical protein
MKLSCISPARHTISAAIARPIRPKMRSLARFMAISLESKKGNERTRSPAKPDY